MKQFNLKPEMRTLSFGELMVIALGERGRNRYETLIPYQDDLSETDSAIAVPTRTGRRRIVRGHGNEGWLARIKTDGVYRRGSHGCVYVHRDDALKVKVLATGQGAYGEAGRLGTWYDYLLELEDFVLLKVQYFGGYINYMYFTPARVFVIEQEEIYIFLEDKDYELTEDCFEKLPAVH